jgi:hypothetical protein
MVGTQYNSTCKSQGIISLAKSANFKKCSYLSRWGPRTPYDENIAGLIHVAYWKDKKVLLRPQVNTGSYSSTSIEDRVTY